MSDLLNRRAALVLQQAMFPKLPQDVQALFPIVDDPLLGNDIPNILIGHLSEQGANPAFPMITVTSEGALEGLTRRTYRHLDMVIDYWVSAGQSPNPGGRRIVSLLYEYSSQLLQDQNFSGGGLCIQRCYETRCSDVLFQAPEKLYHISNAYRVEAIADANVWY